jgi:hypothetical protein
VFYLERGFLKEDYEWRQEDSFNCVGKTAISEVGIGGKK